VSEPGAVLRRGLTHPVAPLVMVPALVALVLAGWAVAAWAVLGGLAGHTLSGSV
jgi:hypothetical protein